MRSGPGNASVPGERRPAGEDGGGHGAAASGRRPASSAARRPRSGPERGAVLAASTGAEFGGCAELEGGPPHLSNWTWP